MKFSPAQLKHLSDKYGSLNSIDPVSDTYVGMIKILDSLPKTTLTQLANAKIKWISVLAKNRV